MNRKPYGYYSSKSYRGLKRLHRVSNSSSVRHMIRKIAKQRKEYREKDFPQRRSHVGYRPKYILFPYEALIHAYPTANRDERLMIKQAARKKPEFKESDFPSPYFKYRNKTYNWIITRHKASRDKTERTILKLTAKKRPEYNENDFNNIKPEVYVGLTYEDLVQMNEDTDDPTKRGNIKLVAKKRPEYNEKDFASKLYRFHKLPYDKLKQIFDTSEDMVERCYIRKVAKKRKEFQIKDFPHSYRHFGIPNEELIHEYNESYDEKKRAIIKKVLKNRKGFTENSLNTYKSWSRRLNQGPLTKKCYEAVIKPTLENILVENTFVTSDTEI